MGPCSGGTRSNGSAFGPIRGRNRWLVGVVAPLAVAVARDLANPEGFIRQLTSAFVQRKRDAGSRRVRRETKYLVVDADNIKTDIRGSGT